MLTATEKLTEPTSQGDLVQFHALQQDSDLFWLFQPVTVTTSSGKIIVGDIVHIDEQTVHIYVEGMSSEVIKLSDIANIS